MTNFGLYPPVSGRTINAQLKVLIADITLTNNGSFEAIPIPAGFDQLEVIINVRSAAAVTVDSARMYYNADYTEGNYYGRYLNGSGGSTATGSIGNAGAGDVPGASASSGNFSVIYTNIHAVASSRTNKGRIGHIHLRDGASSNLISIVSSMWASTEPITSISVRTDNHPTDLFVAGSRLQVFGVGTFAVALAR